MRNVGQRVPPRAGRQRPAAANRRRTRSCEADSVLGIGLWWQYARLGTADQLTPWDGSTQT
jgi:hypothetical protein